MLLSDIFDQLTFGELRHISLGGYESGGIKPSDYLVVVAHVNMGLRNLFSRFPLKHKELLIQQHDWITNYILDKKFAESNKASSEPIKYIIDPPRDPFNNDLLKIIAVYSELGEERALNKEGDPLSVYTPAFNIVNIPYPQEENTFSVMYRAKHDDIIVGAGFDPTQVYIDLPDYLLEPLLIYIAGRVVGNMGSTDNLNASTQYTSRYELALRQIEDSDLINKQDLENYRAERNGWV